VSPACGSPSYSTLISISAELGGVFFSIREKNFDALARARMNRDFSKKAELETEMARQRDE
jgi:pre-mRNA-splicing factor ATP-dependent RNA helicase DHX38/PRP16